MMNPFKSVARRALGERAYSDLSKRKNNAKALWRYYVARYFRREKYMGYDRDYYQGTDGAYGHSFAVMAAGLVAQYHPARVVDIGCGSGAFGQQLLAHGVREVFGFDQSADAVALARENGLTGADVLDVTTANSVPMTADVCTSFEVAEHVPGMYARRLVELLAGSAPAVVMTAAPPGQGGHLHVNEQLPDYWIELMSRHGMTFDAAATVALKAAWHGKVAAHYHDNLLAFRRSQ
jgi:2-polyprenyl-3-methyl-5-hydroxy-6-metoxy-1,4-benzoquinol methylase